MSIHNQSGFQLVGLNKVGIDYPFKKPVDIFEDFVGGNTGDYSKTGTGKFLIGGVNSLATSVATVTSEGTPGGYCRFTTAGASADSVGMLWGNSAPVNWSTSATDPLPWTMQQRFEVVSIASCTQLAGVSPYNQPDSFTTQSASSAYIVVTNGALGYQYKIGATTVATTAATWEDGTTATIGVGYHTFRIDWDGLSTLVFYVNGRLIKRATVPAFTAAQITVGTCVGATTAAAKTLDLDYWYLCQQTSKDGR